MTRFKIYYFGKIKNSEIANLSNYYAKLLGRYYSTELIELKEVSGRKVGLDDLKINSTNTYLLSEFGKSFSTIQFSEFVEKQLQENAEIAFVIANAFGFEVNVLETYPQLSLSPLTFPHELALVLLLEQLFRVCDLKRGGKYHK